MGRGLITCLRLNASSWRVSDAALSTAALASDRQASASDPLATWLPVGDVHAHADGADHGAGAVAKRLDQILERPAQADVAIGRRHARQRLQVADQRFIRLIVRAPQGAQVEADHLAGVQIQNAEALAG